VDKIGMVHNRENCVSAMLGVKQPKNGKGLDRVTVLLRLISANHELRLSTEIAADVKM